MTDLVLLHAPTPKLEKVQMHCFAPAAREFLSKLHHQFDAKIDQLYKNREKRSAAIQSNASFAFKNSAERRDKSWTIAPLPPRLQNRKVDLGDVSPANTIHFALALSTDCQAIQVDFDDGHCPAWKNQLLGYNNIFYAVHETQKLPGAPPNITMCPIMMFRPRAWNIIEHNVLINNKEVAGALFDFGTIMYHNAKRLYETKCGPYFYLSKLESASEARLWNEIFVWTQHELGIPKGTIKACVLVENIMSVFELDEILFALKDHSLGLNCGMWDYCASIVAKLGDRSQFLLPDRKKYVNMGQHFLSSYLKVVVAAAHARGAPATGGMAPCLLNHKIDDTESNGNLMKVLEDKLREMDCGVDGFIAYDPLLVPLLTELWKKRTTTPNQIHLKLNASAITPRDLLSIPSGGVTMAGLEHNVAVTIMFIYYWLEGKGHYFYQDSVEDSATADISRWQVWQWVRFGVTLEDYPKRLSSLLVEKTAAMFILDAHKRLCRSNAERKRLTAARYMSLELFFARNPPEYITSYLNDSHKFRTVSNKAFHQNNL